MRLDGSSNDLRDEDEPRYWQLPELRRDSLWERCDRHFKVSARGSTVKNEVYAGCVTWSTMSYILLVNPVILSKADDDPHSSLAPWIAATAISSAIGSFLVGVLGKAPVGLMPGMGLNAYFTYGICRGLDVTWRQALSCCFASGLLLLALSLLGVCHWIVRRVLTEHLKRAITISIGLLQGLIGFRVMGLVVASPETIVMLGPLEPDNHRLWMSLAGLCLIACMLVSGRVHGALQIGIGLMAVLSWGLGLAKPPERLLAWPAFDKTMMIDFSCWLPGSNKLGAMIIGTVVMLFVLLVDVAGVQYGLYGMAGLLKDGNVTHSKAVFSSTALGTIAGAVLGTSPLIIANESSAGIMEGARTGLSAIAVSVCFALSVFIAPVVSAVPKMAAAVPLVLIGALMMEPSRGIDWGSLRSAVPSFLTVTLVPFSYAIHSGVLFGLAMDLVLGWVGKLSSHTEFSPHFTLRDTPLTFAEQMQRRSSRSPYTTFAGSDVCDNERLQKVRQLLHELGPGDKSKSSAETWDDVLRKSLETYVQGVEQQLSVA